MTEIRKLLPAGRILPVLTLEDADIAVPLARLFLENGIGTIEITMRTPSGLEAIAAIRQQVPEMIVAAGTLVSAGQVTGVMDAGAHFAVTPGFDEILLMNAQQAGLSVLPGVMTPGEAMRALALGYDTLKLFPATVAGGVEWLRAIAGPLPELMFCPTGGVDQSNLKSFLALSNVACVGGSWLASAEDLRHTRWDLIRQNIVETLEQSRTP